MKNYIALFENIIEDLKTGEDKNLIEVLELDFRTSHEDQDDIAYTSKEIGLELSAELLEFYTQIHLVTIRWRLKSLPGTDSYDEMTTDLISGSINIVPYYTMLTGDEEDYWKGKLWFEYDDAELKEDMQLLKPFDYYYSDDSNCACLQVHDGVVTPALSHFGNEAGLLDMGITMDKYLSLLSKSRGFLFWPRAYLSENSAFRKQYDKYMPKLFEDTSLL